MGMPTSVRFDDDLDGRLDKISRESGLSKADLVRRAVQEWVQKVCDDGKLTIELRETPPPYRTKPKSQVN